jgi:DNA-binding response OmpR family regulator
LHRITIKSFIIASHKTYHLLVAGNDATIDEKLRRQLNVQGVEIAYAQTPNSLNRYLQIPGAFDAVLVDGDEMDTTMIRIIKPESLQYNPLLILTSVFRTSAMALALQAGFDEFLAKPVRKDTLCALLNRTNQHSYKHKTKR